MTRTLEQRDIDERKQTLDFYRSLPAETLRRNIERARNTVDDYAYGRAPGTVSSADSWDLAAMGTVFDDKEAAEAAKSARKK